MRDDTFKLGHVDLQSVLALFDHRSAEFDRVPNDTLDFNRRPDQVQPPAGDAPNVQQVVDQPSQVPDLTLDDVVGALHVRRVRAEAPQKLACAGDRGQRAAQLVAQRRKELVFVAIGGLELCLRRAIRTCASRYQICSRLVPACPSAWVTG